MTVTNVICGDSFSCGRAWTRGTERLAEHVQRSWNASSTFADRDFGAEARLSVVENRRSIGALAGASDRPRGSQSAWESDQGSAREKRASLISTQWVSKESAHGTSIYPHTLRPSASPALLIGKRSHNSLMTI